MSEQNFVEVYRARDDAQALVMRSALEEAGIRVMVENDLLQGSAGELPIGWATAPRLMVAEGDAVRARDILMGVERAETASQDSPDGSIVCLSCGGRMSAGQAACPACGWSYKAKGSGEARP